MPLEGFTCKVCDSAALEEILHFDELPRVTSDCIPFRQGGRLTVCTLCGAAQALADGQWLSDIAEIYGKYEIYHQSGGVEQQVFDSASGKLRRRSDVLVDRVLSWTDVPTSGKVLDMGCGAGGTLRTFAERDRWLLYGAEMDERNLPLLAPIPGFQKLYTCDAKEIPDTFDIITMVHSLEHLQEPSSLLSDLRGKLSPNGRLVIQVPNAALNPFDYVVADHMIHFSPAPLANLLRRSGFDIEYLSTDWIPKEISVVARVAVEPQTVDWEAPGADVVGQVGWLRELVKEARIIAQAPADVPFGLFGSSIAAAWLWQAVRDRVTFFVDQDSSRVGKEYLGIPVLSPPQVPAGAIVFVPLAPQLAGIIGKQLQGLPFDLRLPPPVASTSSDAGISADSRIPSV
jgi:2-polyprenyl-3-methyl-5-hydroxy-6-metoxy-1,4-benzoquinol methylase